MEMRTEAKDWSKTIPKKINTGSKDGLFMQNKK